MKKYYIKQKISGAIIALIGILTPILDNGNATFTLLALPLGIYLIVTKEKVIENKTDKKIRIIFDDEDVENFSVPPNDWVGVLADEEGYFSLNEIKSHAFNVMGNL